MGLGPLERRSNTMTIIDASIIGGILAVTAGLVELAKIMAKKRNGGDSTAKIAGCIKDMLHQNQRTAESVEKLADHVNELTTTVAVIDTKVTGIDAKLDRMAV
ncbi:hypothetical protein LCGC14_2417450 [marine sediment metagenome]|uniref:Uncharacterized protein n=1 Tax=marine sediment metagenome TaxID=412755 RepID=A0A0F9EK35_9ZZZZ